MRCLQQHSREASCFCQANNGKEGKLFLPLEIYYYYLLLTLYDFYQKQAAEKQVPEPALLGSKSGIAPENPIGVITEYDDEEFAKQLTLFEYSIFKAIEPRECLCTSFDDPSSSERAPHISQMKTNYDLV